MPHHTHSTWWTLSASTGSIVSSTSWVILDRLLARQWLQPTVLLTWTLQASKVELMHRAFVWELVAVAMERLGEKSEEDKVESVRVLLAGLNRALRLSGKNEGLIVYVENRVRRCGAEMACCGVECVDGVQGDGGSAGRSAEHSHPASCNVVRERCIEPRGLCHC